MATHGIPKPGEIAAENIIRPAFDELLEEQRQTFEVLKTKRQEEIEVLHKKQEKDPHIQATGLKSDDVSLGIPPAWSRQGLDSNGLSWDPKTWRSYYRKHHTARL